jgi:glycosyltransferase involved in cell wall biosynthesis
MKVLWTCMRFSPARGAVEDDLLRIGKILVKSGYDIDAATSDIQSSSPLKRVPEKKDIIDGITVKRARAYRVNAEESTMFVPGIFRAVMATDADIVHSHSFRLLSTYWAKKRRGKRWVVSPHYYSEMLERAAAGIDGRKGMMRRSEIQSMRKTLPFADAVVAENTLEAEHLRSVLELDLDNVRTIPRAIDFSRFEHTKDPGIFRKKFGVDGRVVLFAGKLEASKGLDTLLEAVPAVVKEFIDARFVITGKDGGVRTRLEKKAKFLGIEDKVLFTGAVEPDMMLSAYSACDLFVLPPEYEASGMALLEAMACGKACIGTKTGLIPDALIHGKTGLLVEYGNREILAERICQLLLDDHTRNRMGDAARERVKGHFTYEKVAGQYDTLYADLA